jgi:hypothetical protein
VTVKILWSALGQRTLEFFGRLDFSFSIFHFGSAISPGYSLLSHMGGVLSFDLALAISRGDAATAFQLLPAIPVFHRR